MSQQPADERSLRRPLLVMLAVALMLPCATPFATASMASTNARNPSVVSTSTPLNPPTSSASLPSNHLHPQFLARRMASVDTSTLDDHDGLTTSKRQASIGKFMRYLNGKGNWRENWKEGEAGASLPSRLLFRYATPLLDLASERRLEVDDALAVSQDHNMNATVLSLTTIYDDRRDKSRRRIEEQRGQAKNKGGGSSNKKVKASQSWLLTRSLLMHQRKALLWTGLLRLINTGVQAFPAILLSRLLRLVEAGESQPPIKAMTAAVSLVIVLLIKMIIENQYFHSVVKCSTEVRGALSGLIFDKSLRLPGGGSGVTHKTDRGSGKKRQALGTGGVLNLMQSDASIIENAAMQFHTIWDGPLQVCMA